ncbi:TIGR04282 family arsenosugar biosynthesis glycosyltransferase [Tunturibacter psychrotolerans]|uniref:TIGR04282 family arsenosugar biosynthesis glycosyltransferase n=1 Tax=Tunturiibacter psychrotolerans TaxID=3069686 RepID=A0AAU7ZK34_9BACT
MTPSTTCYTILDPANPLANRASECALAVMAKAPRPGRVKTRLAPPLTLDQAAELNACFLRDTAANIGAVAASRCAAGVISYTPVGDEGFFDNLLPSDFALIPQRGDGFGERLLATVQDLLSCGFGSVCLVDSDSPTVPAVAFERAIAELQKAGERVVIGPSQDGGYYLIGLKHAHSEVFADVAWSTPSVFAETVAAAKAAGIEVVVLPLWYDVDDGEALSLLTAELLKDAPPPFVTLPGYRAEYTREYLIELSEQGSDR